MENLVEMMAKSGNSVVEAASKDVASWSKLKHSKKDLEFFLKNNITHLKFKPKNAAVFKEIVCTSNTRFIKVFSALKESQKKNALKTPFDGISTDDQTSVLTFNLVANKYNTVSLGQWEILFFLTIKEDNIEVLDKVASELLKKQIDKDLTGEKRKI